jgi:hypothetical protein
MPKLVPYLSEEQIERDAAALLAEYEQARRGDRTAHSHRRYR